MLLGPCGANEEGVLSRERQQGLSGPTLLETPYFPQTIALKGGAKSGVSGQESYRPGVSCPLTDSVLKIKNYSVKFGKKFQQFWKKFQA